MEFAEVLRRRRMVRRFAPDPLEPAALERILAAGLRAPSAGYTQGYALLVLQTPGERELFWANFPAPPGVAGWSPEVRAGVARAPVLILALSCKRAYLERYARPDKGWTDRDENRWPVPYWDVDTGMVALLLLLAAVDEGLAGLLFGVPPAVSPRLLAEFGVPEDHHPVGVVAIGQPEPGVARRDLRDRRRPADELIHRGRW